MFDSYEQIFARRADRYEQAMAMCPRARDAEFAAVIAPIEPGPRTVFDMPAGAGYLEAYLPADNAYVAVEPAGYFFDRCPDAGRSRRIRSGIDRVPSSDGKADAIVSLAGLHHAPDLSAIFAGFQRLLRPGGKLVIADVGAATAPARFLNGYAHANSAMGHEGRFLDAAVATLLERAGFALIDDGVIAVPWRFAHADQAGAYGADLFGIDGRSSAEVSAALAEIVGVRAEPGAFTVDWCLRRIVCRKR
jgi:SAM-dependent methyltransferase